MENYKKARKMYMEYLDDFSNNVIHQKINEEEKKFKSMQLMCEEYGKLKFTCLRLLEDAPEVVEGKTELGQKIFMNMEVRDTKHVVVKISDDFYVKMNLTDAVAACDRKIEMYKKLMTSSEELVVKLKTNITMLLASMDMPYVEPYKFQLPPDFPFSVNN